MIEMIASSTRVVFVAFKLLKLILLVSAIHMKKKQKRVRNCALILVLAFLGCTKPQPVQVEDFPDTDNPIMQNVTIEYWSKGHKAMVIRTPQLEIKK